MLFPGGSEVNQRQASHGACLFFVILLSLYYMKIAVVGLWHLGSVYSACLAELGHDVRGIANDRAVVKNLNKGAPPVSEPGLSDLIIRNIKGGRLFYSWDYRAISDCDAVWIAIDTPLDEKDRANTGAILSVIKDLAPHFKQESLLIVSSQLPVGTSQKVVRLINKKNKNARVSYAYMPENLRLGEAINNFSHPERLVVGCDDTRARNKVEAVLRGLKTEIMHMNVASAEMTKHALNAFLATSLSFIYDIADVCERVGASVVDVARAVRADKRIGPAAYLDASAGFSGGTLGRDLGYLLAVAKHGNIELPVIRAVLEKNTVRRKIIYTRLQKALGSLTNKRIGLFGITYKYGTNTLRRSLALDVARDLHRKKARLQFCDPCLRSDEIKKEFTGQYAFSTQVRVAAKGCAALIFMTPWPELANLDFADLATQAPGAVFFDARNYFYNKRDEITNAGFIYMGVGV